MKTSRLFISLVALFSAFSIARAAQYDQRVTSLATRGQVGTGNNVMITGFIVTDGAPKRILIRAVGQRSLIVVAAVPIVILEHELPAAVEHAQDRIG